jgi:hypothetical protein
MLCFCTGTSYPARHQAPCCRSSLLHQLLLQVLVLHLLLLLLAATLL